MCGKNIIRDLQLENRIFHERNQLSHLTIEIRNPDFGSHPRRTVADVYLHINRERISVAEKLFETRYAVPFSFEYDFQWGQPELDFESWYKMLGIDDPITPDVNESIPENG